MNASETKKFLETMNFINREINRVCTNPNDTKSPGKIMAAANKVRGQIPTKVSVKKTRELLDETITAHGRLNSVSFSGGKTPSPIKTYKKAIEYYINSISTFLK